MIRARIVAANAAIAHCRNGQRVLGEECCHTLVAIDCDRSRVHAAGQVTRPAVKAPASIRHRCQPYYIAVVIWPGVVAAYTPITHGRDRQRVFILCKARALTLLFPLMVIEAGFALPLRSPVQLAKLQPVTGVAVSCTTSP